MRKFCSSWGTVVLVDDSYATLAFRVQEFYQNIDSTPNSDVKRVISDAWLSDKFSKQVYYVLVYEKRPRRNWRGLFSLKRLKKSAWGTPRN